MDWTPLEHAAITLLCAGIGGLCGDIYVGSAFGMALMIGREHAQAEYRWIEKYGKGLRQNMPWWGGFDVRVWDIGSLLDWCVPVLVGAGLVGLLHCLR